MKDFKSYLELFNFKKIKSDVKEPVNNPTQAKERKAKFKTRTLICLILLGICAVLTIVPFVGTVAGIVLYAPGIGAAFFGFMWFTAGKIEKQLRNLCCDKCGERIPYGEHVTVDVLRKREKVSSNANSNSRGDVHASAERREYTTVKITCQCQKCNAVKSFQKEFCTGIIKASGTNGNTHVTNNDRPLEERVKNYFNGIVEIGY